jgi:hypothetical protein
LNPTPKELAEQHDAGLTYAEIGERYGKSGDWVAGRIRRYLNRQRLREAARSAALDRGADQAPPVETDGDGEVGGDKIEIVSSQNSQEIDTRSRRIQTLEQLLEACKVDLDTWSVDHYVVNKWEVGSKDPDGQIAVAPLFQVKAWLVRKVPVKVRPVVSPVEIQVRARAIPRSHSREMKAALCLADPHFGFRKDMVSGALQPFHDRRALDAVLKIAYVLAPDDVFFLGDVNDFAGWSDKFLKEPGFYFTTQPALIEAAWVIGQFKAATRGGRTVLIDGNHDVRPERAMVNHLVEAYQLRAADQMELPAVMSIDNLLGLSRMGVEYLEGYPDRDVWINEHARLIHGEKVRAQPGQTAAAVVRDAHETTVFGHIHRREMATKTIAGRRGPRLVQAYCPGCLCHVDGRVPGSSRRAQWQQGAVVIWYNDETCNITPIDIENGHAFFNGHVFEGEDYARELSQQTGWEFGRDAL